jgi:LacI family transcriptional regulator
MATQRSAGQTPLFQSLVDDLRRQIADGRLAPGDKLPSIAALCEAQGVSAITVRRALSDLSAAGLVIGHQGKGVFVASQARAVVARRTSLIGLIIPEVAQNPFFAGMHAGAQAVLGRDHHLVVGSAGRDLAREAELLRDFAASGVRGILWTPITGDRPAGSSALASQLGQEGLTLVCVDRHLPDLEVDRVSSDNQAVGRLAGGHLLALGHRRIAYVWAHDCPTFAARRAGLEEALAEAGLALDPALARGGWSAACDYAEAGYIHTLELLHHADPPTAILAGNDLIAFGVLRAAQIAGRRVPADLSVIGVDDLPLAAYAQPPLTTIRQDTEGMGRTAAELLTTRLAGHEGPPRVTLLAPHLVVRSSTAGPLSPG